MGSRAARPAPVGHGVTVRAATVRSEGLANIAGIVLRTLQLSLTSRPAIRAMYVHTCWVGAGEMRS